MRAPLDREFFAGDTLAVARRLLGCTLAFDGCEGVIVETEGYKTDAASHFATRRVKGRALAETYGQVYVYLNYGMYYLLNFTTERRGVGAVLIRAVEPTRGMEKMMERRGVRTAAGTSGQRDARRLTNGPGKLCAAFGITAAQDGRAVGEEIRLYPRHRRPAIETSTRVGITKAADLPWRYFVRGNAFVSRP